MKKIYLYLLIAFATTLHAQIVVTPGGTALSLAQTIAGSGITISNAVLTCTSAASGPISVASGTFSNGNSGAGNIGIGSGVLLTTGTASDVVNAASFNSGSSYSSNVSDPHLTAISTNANINTCRLEFDFVPLCTNLNVNYVFASEEYPYYVCSAYNDAFGFFISGPGITGTKNIATIPTTTIGVAINSINGGVTGGGGTIGGCTSLAYSSLYTDNTFGTQIVYDGYTKPLVASHTVTPCQTYHLKLVIADATDTQYDSGVFLQQNGITCSNTPTITATPNTICSGQSTTLTINSSIAGTFTWSPGASLSTTTGSVVVASPTTTTIYTVTTSYGCGQLLTQTITVTVNSSPAVTVNSPTICSGNSGTLTASQAGSGTNSFYNYNDYSIPDNLSTGVTSTISVTGLSGSVGTSLSSVCLNISHTYDSDLTLKLTCPNGTSITLAAGAGGSGNNFTSTCFSTAGTAIGSGTAPFTGNYTPQHIRWLPILKDKHCYSKYNTNHHS